MEKVNNLGYDRQIIFHFNKGHLQDPNIKMWVVKSKGQTYYVDHLESKVPFNTKETPENSITKASIRLKGNLTLIENDNIISALIE